MNEMPVWALLLLLMIVLVCLPVLPAFVIFKTFPDTKVGLSGPLQGLTLNATGAFAAYCVVFLLTLYVALPIKDAIVSSLEPAWTIDADLRIYNKEGQPIDWRQAIDDGGIKVTYSPPLERISSGTVRLRIPGLKRAEWPNVLIEVPGFGRSELDLAQMKGDDFGISDGYKVKLVKPIVVRQYKQSPNTYLEKQYINK
jgi:hypothetical protein